MPDKPVAIDPLELAGLFYRDPAQLGTFSPILADAIPEATRRLLDHQHHMTVTVEKHHGQPVEVEVLEEVTSPGIYCREIVLRRRTDRQGVLYGMIRLRTGLIPPPVIARILGKETPLGRVLIEHGVMRRVELLELWQVLAGERLALFLGLKDPSGAQPICYGRTAILHVDSRPAIELLEIVPPA